MDNEWDDKDPDEVLDYKLTWSLRLAEGDTITSSTWIVPVGLTKNSDTFDDTSTTIWIGDGSTAGEYTLTNRVTTAGGRTHDQSKKLTVVEK